jgi:Xaa-Pro aminopeptidase
MKDTIALAEAAYGAVRRRLEPGRTEFQAYEIIHDAIVTLARTSVELRGDFGCGLRAVQGGPPTSNKIKAGDLCIFDLFPVYQGYRCDLCRTFCVGEPSSEQMELWKHVADAHQLARRLIRPGLSARAVYAEIREHLDQLPGTRGSFTHHAGHGVGQEGWEHPWLNAAGDQVFVKGEVIACEPGLYSASLGGGIRLEHNYLVTADGPIPLDNFPLDL